MKLGSNTCMVYLKVKLEKKRCRWCKYKLNCEKHNVFIFKQTTKKVTPNVLRGFEVKKKVGLTFGKANESLKGKSQVCSGYKQKNKLCLVYFECKLQQHSYGWCIFKLKDPKSAENICLGKSKQRTRCWLMFLNVKLLTETKQFSFWTLSTNKQGTVYVFSA